MWSDSRGRIWVSYWNTGQVGMYDPATRAWREWKLPGNAHAYSVWVDDRDKVWLTDWSINAIVRFDPVTEKFERYESNRGDAERAPDARPLGRSLGRGIGQRPAGHDPGVLTLGLRTCSGRTPTPSMRAGMRRSTG